MLSARLGHFLDTPLGFIAKRIPFSPNVLSITGFLITVSSSIRYSPFIYCLAEYSL